MQVKSSSLRHHTLMSPNRRDGRIKKSLQEQAYSARTDGPTVYRPYLGSPGTTPFRNIITFPSISITTCRSVWTHSKAV